MSEEAALSSPRNIDDFAALRARLEALEAQARRSQRDGLALLVFSGERDRLLLAFTLAVGAAACGLPVSMFFTFWGTAALKKHGPQAAGKSLVERMFGWLLPGGLARRRLSRLDMGGLGRLVMAREMRRKQVADLDELVAIAAGSGVRIFLCDTSMNLMGIRTEELIEYPDMQSCGVARFLELAGESQTTMFI